MKPTRDGSGVRWAEPAFALALLLCLACLVLDSCGSGQSGYTGSKPAQAADRQESTDATACATIYRIETGKPFTIQVSLINNGGFNKPAQIDMKSGGQVKFDPSSFPLGPGDHREVQAIAQSSLYGLVEINAFSSHGGSPCDLIVDAGFAGHLKAPPLTLAYGEQRSVSIQIVDKDDHPLPVNVGAIVMEVSTQDAEASLHNERAGAGALGGSVFLPIPAGSSSSKPFLLRSTNPKGGPVRVLATLSIEGRSVIAQNVFTFDSDPWAWLPVLLAIGGALLCGVFRLLRTEARQSALFRECVLMVLSSVVAGCIAWLFADFDLLGLKLDPHVLRTYAILGFLFSYIGVDILLKKKAPGDGNQI